eukprot:g5397.t1
MKTDTPARAPAQAQLQAQAQAKAGSSAISSLFAWAIRLPILAFALSQAYSIRLYAIKTYGAVIHEFDPWFNYRATVYLAENGWEKFSTWYDYESWWPLGRPIGTTIYPGMQVTAVFLWRQLNALGISISLNDVCVYIPAWFGVVATIFLGLLAYECTQSVNAGIAASTIMAVIPAHLMRSVGGGYDNESIAMSAMMITFYFWALSLRGGLSWLWGAVAGLAYFYMVAVWGGYVFVINMVGVHAGFMVVSGRYSSKLHRAYSLFYVIGTYLAIQVPVVGLTPLKSMEQMMPLLLFLGLQLLEVCEMIRVRLRLPAEEIMMLRLKVCGGGVAALLLAVMLFAPTGYFGPLSSRVRGLFVQHTRTGNPLVDSVAEHQPASADAYWHYLNHMCYAAPIGWVLTMQRRTDAKTFLTLYGTVAYYFSSKMSRLIILIGPVASALGGVAVAAGVEWALAQRNIVSVSNKDDEEESRAEEKSGKAKKSKSKAKTKAKTKTNKKRQQDKSPLDVLLEPYRESYNSEEGHMMRRGGAIFFFIFLLMSSRGFYRYCHRLGIGMSQPSIMYQARMRDGTTVMVRDYVDAYEWLRDNTPEDSRVMAWWDYGYQINGIANRTTIADGNTWNHEHIATLGRCLTSPEKDAHRIIRHLADYVLVWAGGGGDDLAKSPHMARIGNSVFHDICPEDPTCSKFGFDRNRNPTKMMAESLLYKLHSSGIVPGVEVDENRFALVYQSKYGKVRIFKVKHVSKKSKAWVMDPANRVCDAPGSWYCVGQYPPKLAPLIQKRRAFKQLEDFNVETSKEDEEYNKKYMKKMAEKRL